MNRSVCQSEREGRWNVPEKAYTFVAMRIMFSLLRWQIDDLQILLLVQ